MFKLLKGVVPYQKEEEQVYTRRGWWKGMALSDYLDKAADMHPQKEAFADNRGKYTYAQAREKTNRLAIGLIKLGIQPLDRVLVQLPNWNEFIFAYFACQKIGAIPVLLIDRYRQFEIEHLLKISEATTWIVSKKINKSDFTLMINDVLRDNPVIKKVITVRGRVDGKGFESLENLIKKNPITPNGMSTIESRKPDSRQVAHMGPTGGTTGKPKIVPRTHNSLACGVELCSKTWNQHFEDVNMIACPIGHDLSFTKGLLGSVITFGKLVFQESTDPEEICKTIQKKHVTSIVCVPTLIQRMLQYEKIDNFDLSSLRKIHGGGCASHSEMVKELMDRYKVFYYNGYGGTEGMSCNTRIEDDFKTICNTVGKPTSPYDIYKIVDVNGKTLPPNTTGELLAKGPGIFTGYYKNLEENNKVFTKDGFFKTGDLAKMNEKGYITLSGRIKEMINRGGECISSTEIERLICRHPGIIMAAVIPVPDKIMSERVCAYIENKSDVVMTFEDVITFLKSQKVSVLQLPEYTVFVKKMPLTKTGKIDKKLLLKDFKKRNNHKNIKKEKWKAISNVI